MRFDEIRKTGKTVLVNMSRRRVLRTENGYGLEAFKMEASKHWVEGVVIDRQKGIKKAPHRIIVAVSRALVEEASKVTDIQSVLKHFVEDVDYKEFYFSLNRDKTRRDELNLSKVDSNVYSSHMEDERLKAAIEQDRDVLSLLRKNTEEWTDEDLQSFFFLFMLKYLPYRVDITWYRFDEVGVEAAGIMRHARYLYGISGQSGWNETEEKYRNRLFSWDKERMEAFNMQKALIDGYNEKKDSQVLRDIFEKYCLFRDAHKGISVEQILRRREDVVDNIPYKIAWSEKEMAEENALKQFYTEFAVNPDEEAKSKFVLYKKIW